MLSISSQLLKYGPMVTPKSHAKLLATLIPRCTLDPINTIAFHIHFFQNALIRVPICSYDLFSDVGELISPQVFHYEKVPATIF